MITTSSMLCASSARTWLEIRTVRPSPARRLRKPRSQRMPSGSRPLDGSSRTSVSGSPSRAAASARRCRIPIEKPPTRRGQLGEPDHVEHLVDPTVPNAGGRADDARARTGPVARVEDAGVEQGTDVRAGCARSAYACPSKVARPRVGRTSPRSMRIVVDFPAPLGPRNPVTAPGRTVEAEVVDRGDVAVALGQAVELDRCHTSTLGRRGWRGVGREGSPRATSAG